jgi:hypothetical protein
MNGHASPIPVSADENAIPIDTPILIPSFPRIPTPTHVKDMFSLPEKSTYVVDFDKVRRGSFFKFKNVYSKVNYRFM